MKVAFWSWTHPCLQGMLQRVINTPTALAWLQLEASETEIKAVKEEEGWERKDRKEGRSSASQWRRLCLLE